MPDDQKNKGAPVPSDTYYRHDNALFRKCMGDSDSRVAVDDVLQGDRWVPYNGDCLEPVFF